MTEIAAFNFSVELLTALLWEYNNTPALTSLLKSKDAWYLENQTTFWNNWLVDIFNLKTATQFGCDVWALILGVPLQSIAPEESKINWGFGHYRKNFTHGNFTALGSNIALSLEQRRIVLQIAYYKTFLRCTVPEINQMLADVLGNYGGAYILDGNDMSYTVYVLNFQPTDELLYVLQNFDILPRPAGVGLKVIVSTRPVYGFGNFNKNFNNGNFEGNQ